MHWASGLSESTDLLEAVERASDTVDDQLGEPPQLVLCFFSPQHDDRAEELPGALRERFPDAVLLGCSGGGVIGDGREIERAPALSLTAAALPGVGLIPFHFDVGQAPRDPAAWRERLGLSTDHQPCFILLPEPFTCSAPALLEGLDAAYPGAPKIGGLASGGRHPGANALLLEDGLFRAGVAGLALYGDLELSCVVAQGCRPVGPALTVTRARRSLVLELDGARAVDSLDRVYGALGPRDQELFRRAPMLGLVMDPGRGEPRAGDYLVRDVVGLDRGSGAVSVGALVGDTAQVRFHVRDARASAEELDDLLGRHHRERPEPPAGALLFSCLGRGRGLFGVQDHDSMAFRRHLGPAALGGFFCGGEIGPIHARTHLHGYTSAFGFFRPKGWN